MLKVCATAGQVPVSDQFHRAGDARIFAAR
jgi:hypothetical protein